MEISSNLHLNFFHFFQNRNYKANFFILRQYTENSTANDESADSDPRRLRFESFIVHRWGDIR